MIKNAILIVLLLGSYVARAEDNPSRHVLSGQQFSECVGVSLFTRDGREINSIAVSDRETDSNSVRVIEPTNHIPEGWSVIGVTTKKEALITEPYLVICR